MVALIFNVGVEAGAPIAKEGTLPIFQIAEGVVGQMVSVFKRHHVKHTHKANLQIKMFLVLAQGHLCDFLDVFVPLHRYRLSFCFWYTL